QVWRSVRGETGLARSVGHVTAAIAAYLVTSSAMACGKQRVAGFASALANPGGRHLRGGAGERGGPLLPPFALASDVGSVSELDILAGEPAQLGDPHSRLDGDGEQRVVAAATPAVPVRSGRQGVGLGALQERHDGPVEALGRDGEHPCDEGGVLGMAQGRKPEQRVDRRQARVAALSAVAPPALEVVQERADSGGVEVIELQLRRGLSTAVLGECAQQPEPVGRRRWCVGLRVFGSSAATCASTTWTPGSSEPSWNTCVAAGTTAPAPATRG